MAIPGKDDVNDGNLQKLVPKEIAAAILQALADLDLKDFTQAVPSNDSGDNLSATADGLYVGVQGDVVVIKPDDSAVTIANLISGVWHNFPHKRVVATGTTAANILHGWR